MRYEQALAHAALGRHATGAERRDHQARARASFARCGNAYELSLLEGLWWGR